jgi:succinate-semialdehyde dehydrogenase/glutarate-semialdehyde dehydrogenase
MGETESGIKAYEWYAEECKRVNGDIIPSTASSKRFLVLKQPVGVCGFVTPVRLMT